jgi:hypothetical protein
VAEAGARPDFVYQRPGSIPVAVFVDGPVHDGARQAERDAEAEERLADIVWDVVRVRYDDDWSAVRGAAPVDVRARGAGLTRREQPGAPRATSRRRTRRAPAPLTSRGADQDEVAILADHPGHPILRGEFAQLPVDVVGSFVGELSPSPISTS